MLKVPEKYRTANSDESFGNNGFFVIPHHRINKYIYRVQVSDGLGWEHVSISVGEKKKQQHRCPTWEEMCYIKGIFWDEEDCVIQYHPAKKDYINMHPYVLHLWRPTDVALPTPPSIMVGVNL